MIVDVRSISSMLQMLKSVSLLISLPDSLSRKGDAKGNLQLKLVIDSWGTQISSLIIMEMRLKKHDTYKGRMLHMAGCRRMPQSQESHKKGYLQ